MADTPYCQINAKWALAYDELQWILQRHKGVRKSRAQAGEDMWRAVSFVSSTRDVLASCMAGPDLAEDGNAAVPSHTRAV